MSELSPAEQKRLKSVIKSASFLQSCFPPMKQAVAARTLCKLAGPKPDEILLESLLEGSTQRLTPVSCPNPNCGQDFLFSACSRDGDGFRCIYCNKIVLSDGSCEIPSNPLSKSMRGLEKYLNMRFLEYKNAYFGSKALVNCFVNANEQEDPRLITVTVLIRKVAENDSNSENNEEQQQNQNESEETNKNPSVWNSLHTIHLVIDRDYQIDVISKSTIYIESQSKPCRFSGHISRPTPKFSIAIPESLHPEFEANRRNLIGFLSGVSSLQETRQLIVTRIGELVQRTENRLRDTVGSVYFNKSGQVGTDLRCPIGRTEHTATRMTTATSATTSNTSNATATMPMSFPGVDSSGAAIVTKNYQTTQQQQQQAQSLPVPIPTPSAVSTTTSTTVVDNTEKTYWQAEIDEASGETYYVNVETGTTEWLLPENSEVVHEKKSKKDKKDKKEKKEKKEKHHYHHQEEEEEADADQEAEGEEEWTVLSVLQSLELSGATAEEYEQMFSDAEVNTIEEMLQCDPDYIKKSVGVSSSSDRKKINRWIEETYAQVAGDAEE